MKMKNGIAAAFLVVLGSPAQAALVDRGGGMIYDTTRNITWLADMNYAFTSGYAAANAGGTSSYVIQADGRMGWGAATAWANNLVYGGFDDWRLPTVDPSDSTCSHRFDIAGFPPQTNGFNCINSELSGLFITDLGNKAGESVLNQVGDTAEQIANLALFSNVQSAAYWSGTEYAPNLVAAMGFTTVSGARLNYVRSNAMYAMAARPGDVAASVPEPQTLALALLALGATAVARKRRSSKAQPLTV